jgi:SAM-dependent methyltransferase
MIDRDGAFVEGRRKFYEEQYRIAESIDPWHAYSQTVVHSTTRDWYYRYARSRGTRVLNAGSGGSDYGIGEAMTHLDLFESRIANCQSRLVGDISGIPADPGSFDVLICVGSVVNYADPLLAIREFSRVLRPGGLLILEYERSASFEYIKKNGFSNGCCRVETFYGRVPTNIWVYGDGFIDGLMAASGFERVAETRFHALSSVVLAATKSPTFAARFTPGDRVIAQIWPFRTIASNRILAVEKIAD